MSYEQLFNQVCLYIVPMVNPDGVQIAQYGEKETKAIIKLFDSLSNPVGSIAYHSMGNLADWNQNKRSTYYAVNRQMGDVTRKLTGYRTPGVDLSGSVGGTMGTWLSEGKREMTNITIETGNISCPLPYSYYNRLWKDNRYVIESLTKLFYK